MNFQEAVQTVLSKYVDFTGRARRSEYWYFALFSVIVSVITRVLDGILGTGSLIALIVSLALFLPGLAVAVRRMHDIDRSGWWILIGIIPLVGWILVIVWAATEGTHGPNRFGADPKNPTGGYVEPNYGGAGYGQPGGWGGPEQGQPPAYGSPQDPR